MFSRRKIISFAITLLSITGYGFIVFAAVGPFAPGEELDPLCVPGAPNCVVDQLFATTNTTYTWIGDGTGANGGSTDNTFFAGIGAGDNADNAHHSNFVGTDAGIDATNAYNSNFFGPSAGCGAVDAHDSNFFGLEAGCYALHADNSNFFGNKSGYTAVDAKRAVFFGDHSGYFATGAARSNYIGYWSGAYATNAYNSNFSGYRAGMGATGANNSTFMGYEAGSGPLLGVDGIDTIGANGAENSLFVGYQAGYNSLSNPDFLTAASNQYGLLGNVSFVGYQAGMDASGAGLSTFLGFQSGLGATHAFASNFMGYASGKNATDARSAVFIGNSAGQAASNAVASVFIGNNAGASAAGAYEAIFLGQAAGTLATDAPFSTFLGYNSGNAATRSSSSVFIGHNAGWHSADSPNSIFIGPNSGMSDAAVNTSATVTYTLTGAMDPFEIGENVTDIDTGASFYVFSDSGSILETDRENAIGINPGDHLVGNDSGATATVGSTTKGSYSILLGPSTRTNGYINSIAIGAMAFNNASNQLKIGSTHFPIDEMYIQSSGGSCIAGVTGFSCSSDERLKKNITDLEPVLDTLDKVRTVHYQWRVGDTDQHIGFLAQDLMEYFPELVKTDSDGYYLVNYANMTPVLVQAVRELDLKIKNIQNIADMQNQTFINHLVDWFAETTNGIGDFFAGVVHTNTLCVKRADGTERCVDGDQLDQVLGDGLTDGGYGYGYGGSN